MPPPLRRKIPPPKDLPLYLPPHLPTNVGKQVNTRCTLLFSLKRWWTTETKNILNPEQVDELKKVCVSRFNLPALLQPNLIHYHRSPGFCHQHVGAFQRNLTIQPKIRDVAQNLARPPPPHRTPSPSTPQSRQSASALETAERTANVSRCANDCAYRRARRRARSTMMAMPCLAQYAVSPTGAQVRQRSFVRVPRGHPDSRKPAAPQRAAERARGPPSTTERVKTTRSQALGCTRRLEDARFTADACAVLESEQDQYSHSGKKRIKPALFGS